MIEFLKNYQKIIEFVLLFVPLIILFNFLTDLPIGKSTYGYVSSVADLFATFMPFVLWKVFSVYWLK